MDSKRNPYVLNSLILAGLILLIIIFSTIPSQRENKRLKSDINDNLNKIEILESEKRVLTDKIKQDSVLIAEKDSLINTLKNQRHNLNNNLKLLKDESKRNKINYLNGSNDERFIIFSKLATE